MTRLDVIVAMKRVNSHNALAGAAIIATAVLGLAGGLPTVGARDSEYSQSLEQSAEKPKFSNETAAEAKFPDAPDGVDPMVTGPVSEAFRSQQKIAGCSDAEWPDIPLACFPS